MAEQTETEALLNRAAEYVSCVAQMDLECHFDPKLLALVGDLRAAGVPSPDDDPSWDSLLASMLESMTELEGYERSRFEREASERLRRPAKPEVPDPEFGLEPTWVCDCGRGDCHGADFHPPECNCVHCVSIKKRPPGEYV